MNAQTFALLVFVGADNRFKEYIPEETSKKEEGERAGGEGNVLGSQHSIPYFKGHL